MGEGVRLRNSFNVENQPNEPPLQPQRPPQNNVSENTLKQTETNNNIDYTIMETSDRNVLDYLLSSEKGVIKNKK